MNKVIVDLPPPFNDSRGSIQMLVDIPIGSILVITSKKGSIRANHYHKNDDHYCYLASGCIEYYYRSAGTTHPPEVITVEKGQLFYTPPMVEHAMKFLEDSTFYVFSKKNRKQINYESDVVRVKLI